MYAGQALCMHPHLCISTSKQFAISFVKVYADICISQLPHAVVTSYPFQHAAQQMCDESPRCVVLCPLTVQNLFASLLVQSAPFRLLPVAMKPMRRIPLLPSRQSWADSRWQKHLTFCWLKWETKETQKNKRAFRRSKVWLHRLEL